MDTFRQFSAAMQLVIFDHAIVKVKDQKRVWHIYAAEDFWGRVLPAFEAKIKGQAAA